MEDAVKNFCRRRAKAFPIDWNKTKSHQDKLRVIFLIILELNKTVSFETSPNITVICKQQGTGAFKLIHIRKVCCLLYLL